MQITERRKKKKKRIRLNSDVQVCVCVGALILSQAFLEGFLFCPGLSCLAGGTGGSNQPGANKGSDPFPFGKTVFESQALKQ